MEKAKVIEGVRIHEKDTGSSDVQIALLTGRINELTEQFYAISVERRLTHPAVLAVTQQARASLFA